MDFLTLLVFRLCVEICLRKVIFENDTKSYGVWFLTFAHCVKHIVRAEVFLGAINLYDEGVGSFIKSIIVTNPKDIIPHPHYNEIVFANDIDLVKLAEDAPTAENNIGVLGLLVGVNATRNLTGYTGTVSDFGKL